MKTKLSFLTANLILTVISSSLILDNAWAARSGSGLPSTSTPMPSGLEDGGVGGPSYPTTTCYKVTSRIPINSTPGNPPYTEIDDMNSQSQLVGHTYSNGYTNCTAFIKGPEGTQIISTGNSSECVRPQAMNDFGEVVGDIAQNGVSTKAFAWRNGTFTYINYQTYVSSHVDGVWITDINELGDIAGYSVSHDLNNPSCKRELIKYNVFSGSPIAPIYAGCYSSEIVAVNNNRFLAQNNASSGVNHSKAMRESPYAYWNLLTNGSNPGSDTFKALAMNDQNQTVGYDSVDAYIDGWYTSEQRAVVWNPASSATPWMSTPIILGNLFPPATSLQSKERSWAYDINNSGQIVGWSRQLNVSKGFIYKDGQIKDLNTQICASQPLLPGESIVVGEIINDKGEILGRSTGSIHGESFVQLGVSVQ